MIRRARWGLVVALMLWCAGAGCLLVSYAHGPAMAMSSADAAPVNPTVTTGNETTASDGMHGCCKARHSKHSAGTPTSNRSNAQTESSASFDQAALPEAPTRSDAMSCCPLTSGSIILASKTPSNYSSAATLVQAGSLTGLVNGPQPAPLAYPLRLPNQNQTYLRCCVFLI